MFEGMPVWHVSVARITKDRRAIKPRELWTNGEVLDAARIAARTLYGVGDDVRQWTENGDTAIHVRRQLAQPEIDLLYTIQPGAPVFTHGHARPSEGVR